MKTLIVGAGSIGKRHIKNLQQLGYQDILVLRRSPDPLFEQKLGVTVVTSFQEAAKFPLDTVFICTPTALHIDALQFAARKHLHVFMEKPLIHNRVGLIEAQKLMKSYSKVFFIGFMLRYHPLVNKIREFLDRQQLGQVYSARFEFGSFLPYWHPWEDYRDSYASRKSLGGGVINTITHELDLIQYFFGSPTSIFCEKNNFGHLNIGVEEQCEAVFSYPDKCVTLHLDYLQKDYDRNIKILCKEGKIIWDWHTNELLIQKHKQATERISVPNDFEVNDLYIKEVSDFLNMIKEEKTAHHLDFVHAVENTHLMLLMHQSAEEQRKVAL